MRVWEKRWEKADRENRVQWVRHRNGDCQKKKNHLVTNSNVILLQLYNPILLKLWYILQFYNYILLLQLQSKLLSQQ